MYCVVYCAKICMANKRFSKRGCKVGREGNQEWRAVVARLQVLDRPLSVSTARHHGDLETTLTCVLVYNCLHSISPSYLSSMCQPVSVNPSRRCLRSAARGDLVVPATRTVCYMALIASPLQDQLRGTRCRHHSAMTNRLSLHFAVYSRLNFLPEHTTLL